MRCDIMGVQERKRTNISSNDDREIPQTDIRYQSKYPGSSKEIQQDKDHTHKSRLKHVFAENQIIKILKNKNILK